MTKIYGRSLKSIGLVELRKIFAIIPQEPICFEGTLLDNIDPMK